MVAVGTFTGLLKSLPKSGKWMKHVELSSGVILIFIGLYFLFYNSGVGTGGTITGVAEVIKKVEAV